MARRRARAASWRGSRRPSRRRPSRRSCWDRSSSPAARSRRRATHAARALTIAPSAADALRAGRPCGDRRRRPAAAEQYLDARDRQRSGVVRRATRCSRISTRREATSTARARRSSSSSARQPDAAAPLTALGIVLESGRPPRRRAWPLRAGADHRSGGADRVEQPRAALRSDDGEDRSRDRAGAHGRGASARTIRTCTTRWDGWRSGPAGCRSRRQSSNARSRWTRRSRPTSTTSRR